MSYLSFLRCKVRFSYHIICLTKFKLIVRICKLRDTINTILQIYPLSDKMPNSGLLQSGLITLYMMYLTWSAMANNPDEKCNPMIQPSNTTNPDTNTGTNQHMDTTSIIGLVIWFMCLLYSSIRTASSSQAASKLEIWIRPLPYRSKKWLSKCIYVENALNLIC